MDISIIIPCYNHGAYIKEAIQSIKDCGEVPYKYEIIIVNDGSTQKETLDILQQVESEECFVLHQNNKGLGAARNQGVTISKGKYILPLDSDNKIFKPYLTNAIKILEKDHTISVVYGDAEFFGEKTGRWVVGEYNLQKLMIGNFIDACAVFRKEMWEKLNGYDEKMPFMGLEDWDLWLRASFQGYKFYYLPEVCFKYRVLGNSMINSLSLEKGEILNDYLQKKFHKYLGRDVLNEHLIVNFKTNKRLFFKLFLAVFFPKRLIRFKKSGRIKSTKII
jgi:glycosyltransferase involved in cell wall biosynthesis